MSTFNERIIEEFRSNGGKVGGPFEGASMLLLTTTGRRTGRPRTSPLVYTTTEGGWVVAASNAGADEHPQWFLNLQADPHATIEVGDRTVPVEARFAEPEERDRLYAAHAERMPGFAEYERATQRMIPIVVLATG